MANKVTGWGNKLPNHSTVSKKRVKTLLLPLATGVFLSGAESGPYMKVPQIVPLTEYL
jgi:hypothetical protein